MYSEKPTSLYYRWCPSSVQTDPRFRRLTLKQHGFYRLLLDAMWQHELARIEDSFEAVRGWVPIDRRDYKTCIDWLVGVGLLRRVDGFLHSPELDGEYSTAISRSKHASKNAQSKWDNYRKSQRPTDAAADSGQCGGSAPILSVPIRTELPPISPKPVAALPSGFVEFWNAYPRKVGKGDALKAWGKLKPDISLVVKALKWQKVCDDWLRDGGRFIPHPATYLNARRWEDENALEPRRSTQTNRDEPDYYQRALDAEKARLMRNTGKVENKENQ